MARGKHEEAPKKVSARRKPKKEFSKKKVILGVIAAIILAFVIWVLIGVDFGFISSVDKLSLNLMSVVYGRDDKGEFTEFEYISAGEKRVWASYDEISEDYRDAFVAIEDERFYKHHGIDIKRTTGAVINEVFGKSTYGGSTITQQLVKNITGDKERSYVRKFREIIRALVLETKLSKDEILEMYMNSIYLGQGCYGVDAASNFSFGFTLVPTCIDFIISI